VIETYTLYFDGACWPNPGNSGAYGYHLHHNEELIASVSGIVQEPGEKSNNSAEYAGLAAGFQEFLKQNTTNYCELNVFGDSQLVINQMNGKWKIRPNHNGLYVPYARKTMQLCKEIRNKKTQVHFFWIPREKNEEADRLSKLKEEK
jgi:ribonuclease HI